MISDKRIRVAGQYPMVTMKVFFTGATALTKGMGVCFDRDATGAEGSGVDAVTDAWSERCVKVALPSQSNNNAFAGVVMIDYAAKSTGQQIEIAMPGSCVDVYNIDSAATIGETNFLWCIAGGDNAGKFTGTPQGMMGKGCARIMQTLTAAGLCMVELMDGQESGLVEIIPTATLTAGGAITCMVGGTTFFDGAATPGSDCTFTLANGKYVGQIKRFYQDGNLTTNDVVITVTAGEQLDGSTDLASFEMDGDTDDSTLMWMGTKWRLLGNVGSALS